MLTHRVRRSIGFVSIALFGVSAVMLLNRSDAGAVDGCELSLDGDTATLTWQDNGGVHIVRRNGAWLATPGSGSTSHVDTASPPGATYVIRTWAGGSPSDRTCAEPPPPTTTSTTTTTPSTSSTTTTTTSTTTTTTTSTTTTTVPPVPNGCVLERIGADNHLSWADDGGTHVMRRSGVWLVTLGDGVDGFVDVGGPPDATYELRTWNAGTRTDTACLADPGPVPTTTTSTTTTVPQPAAVERVIHVSLDGLRSDHVTTPLMPNLEAMINQGASTLNARTDPDFTKTLPNHHSQFTGRNVGGAAGHDVDYNDDTGTTVHAEAGEYVASVFDVVHDHGGGTVLFAGKSKFDMMDRNWNTNGAPDLVGVDDGTAKIDDYRRLDPATAVTPFIDALRVTDADYGFFHVRTPDEVGHDHTWGSPEYATAATSADAILGELWQAILAEPGWGSSTAIIVVSDHGGPSGGLLHSDASLDENYTIPFVVWGPGVAADADLYQLNAATRLEPGNAQIGIDGQQPIRGHEVANLALDLLGLPPVAGSTSNVLQDLRVG